MKMLNYKLISNDSKISVFYLCCILCAIFLGGIMATDLYIPSLPHIANYFNTATSHVKFTISIYVIGYAVSQLIYGPLSDAIGRYPTILIGMSLFVLGSLGSMLSESIHMLIGMRLLQSLGGGAGMCIARSIVRDLYQGKKLAQVVSYMSIALGILPAFAPLLGGYIQHFFSWKAVFTMMTFISFGSLIAVAIFLPETNTHKSLSSLGLRKILKTFKVLLSNRHFIGNTLIASSVLAGLFVYYTLSPFLLQNLLQISVTDYSWLVFINSTAILFGRILNTFVINRLNLQKTLLLGIILLIIGSILLITPALFNYISVVMIVVPTFIFMLGSGLILSNAMVNAFQAFKKIAGTAASLFSSIQMAFTGIATVIAAHLPSESQFGFSIAMLVISILALLLYIFTNRVNSH